MDNGLTFPEVIDSTMLSDAKKCLQLFQYQRIRGLDTPRQSIHLHAGSVFAKGLETARLLFYGKGMKQEDAIEAAMVTMLSEWGDFEPVFSWDEGAQFENKYLDRLIQAIDHYFEVYPMATDLVQPLMGPSGPTVEFTFAIPLPINHPETGQPLLYGGRFDMLGEYQNQVWVVDEKTTKQLGATWGQQWDLRSQFTGYCWAAQQYGISPSGAIIRGISFLKNSFGDAEVIKLRPQHMIDDWYFNTLRLVNRLIEHWREGVWDRNLDDSCNAYGGCPFKHVCKSPDPEPWLEHDFVVRHWNPLHET